METGVESTACRSHAVDVNGTVAEHHGRVFAEGGHAAGLYLHHVCVCVGTWSGRHPAEDERVCKTALKSVRKTVDTLTQGHKAKDLIPIQSHWKQTSRGNSKGERTDCRPVRSSNYSTVGESGKIPKQQPGLRFLSFYFFPQVMWCYVKTMPSTSCCTKC